MHLTWEVPARPVLAVRATLEIVEPPRTNDLYFFALQASFAERGGHAGGAHLGLQWNNRHPGNTAANWGGYHSQARGGAILDGTESTLPSQPNDPNTRDFPWAPQREYQLEIAPGRSPGWWLGSVTDVASGQRTVVRELHGDGTGLTSPVVWSEVFAPCDAPPVTVAWSRFEYSIDGIQWNAVSAARTNYQDYSAGGCTNTNSAAVDGRWTQTTNTARVTPTQSVLGLR